MCLFSDVAVVTAVKKKQKTQNVWHKCLLAIHFIDFFAAINFMFRSSLVSFGLFADAYRYKKGEQNDEYVTDTNGEKSKLSSRSTFTKSEVNAQA